MVKRTVTSRAQTKAEWQLEPQIKLSLCNTLSLTTSSDAGWHELGLSVYAQG